MIFRPAYQRSMTADDAQHLSTAGFQRRDGEIVEVSGGALDERGSLVDC